MLSTPFVDLGPSCRPLNEAILADVAELLARRFHNGPQVEEFEGVRRLLGRAVCRDVQRPRCVAARADRGRDRAGDEVIVPANTFIATFEAVTAGGGVRCPVDVERGGLQPRSRGRSRRRSAGGRGFVPVHLYGHPADMRALRRSRERAGSPSSRTPARRTARRATASAPERAARIAAFSFYPGKNLGAAGDAGALVTDDDELAERARALREHGAGREVPARARGFTARLDTIQAIVLLHKLPHLDGGTSSGARPPRYYNEALDGVGDLVLPPVAAGSDPVWHLYVVRTADPDGARRATSRRAASGRVATTRSRRTSPGLSRGSATAGVVSRHRAARREVLSLPIFPGITEAQLAAVVDAITEYFEVADRPPTTRPTGSSRTSSSARASSSRPSRTSTAAASATRSRIGPFVEIQRGAVVGARCKIQSHAFICDGVEIGDGVFVGHGVMFINDKSPARDRRGGANSQTEEDWELLRTVVEDGASIGSGAIDPGRPAHRRARAGRRGGGRHARRSRRRDGRREPRETSLDHFPSGAAGVG